MITNFFQDKTLLQASTYTVTGAGYEIYIIRKFDFWRLYYFAESHEALVPGLQHIRDSFPRQVIVCDVIGRDADIERLSPVFESNGFYEYTSLVRMERKPEGDISPAVACKIADQHQTSQIKYFLDNYFDKYAERIPTIKEIGQFISEGTVLIYGDPCIAFLIYEGKGQTSYLRYWFVHPNYRAMGMGSLLLRSWLHRSNHAIRQIFWVIRSNQNAIDKYKHYGFTEEDMIDIVLINKNIQYEAKDN